MTNQVLHGDCLELMRDIPDNSIDSLVTDPPYGLSQHKPSEVVDCLMAWCKGEVYQAKGSGFMGKTWDAWVPGPEVWKEVYRVLKPGSHALIFAGTRSLDLMGMAVRLAGFEMRDTVIWSYGQGFPKNLDISKALDKLAGKEREIVGVKPGHENFIGRQDHSLNGGWDRPWAHDPNLVERYHSLTAPATPEAKQWDGWGTALKPAIEPVLLCRKPLDGTVANNILKHGVGGLNIEAGRIEVDTPRPKRTNEESASGLTGKGGANTLGSFAVRGSKAIGTTTEGRYPANLVLSCGANCQGENHSPDCPVTLFPETHGAGNVKPSYDDPNREYKENSIYQGGFSKFAHNPNYYQNNGGSTARFFKQLPFDPETATSIYYQAKASKTDRSCGGKVQNVHPTVKSRHLIAYFLKLITPPGGTVLDCFGGSGTTAIAAIENGFNYCLIEKEPEYIEIINQRIAATKGGGKAIAVSTAPTPPTENPEAIAQPNPEPTQQLSLF